MMKDLIHQEDIALVNIYELNLRAPKYSKQILIGQKREKHITIQY